MDADSSVELLARVRVGDREALDQLLRRYVPALRRWASGRLPRWARDLAETEDLVQDTVLKSLGRLDSFEYRQEGAVMNRIRDECRRVARRPGIDEIDALTPDDGISPLEAAIGVEAVAKYEVALAGLRDEDRQAIVARIEMGYSYGEVAVMLGKPTADAARMVVSRALVRLAEAMRYGR
jgi:RNA polymerase sigma-70 factor (ECF subfamily)